MGVGGVRGMAACGAALLVAAGCDLGQAPVPYPAASRAVQVADVDGDGDLDVVATGAGQATVLGNDGTGTLTAASQAVALDVYESALGDVDGDGDTDRVDVHRPAGAAHGEVWLAHGDGAGGFGTPEPVLVEAWNGAEIVAPGNDVALADLDGDADLDLLMAGPAGVWPVLNDGAGGFGGPFLNGGECGSPGSGTWPRTAEEVTTGDLDGDGDTDALWTGRCDFDAGSGALVGVELNDGAGGLSWGLTTGGPGSSRTSPAVGDLDEDGNLDWVVADPVGNRLEVTLGLAAQPAAVDLGSTVPGETAMADIDGDGHLDVVVSTPGAGTLTVFYGDGTGAFPDRHVAISGADEIDSLATGDLDGDGSPDLVLGTDNATAGPEVRIMRNTLVGRAH